MDWDREKIGLEKLQWHAIRFAGRLSLFSRVGILVNLFLIFLILIIAAAFEKQAA